MMGRSLRVPWAHRGVCRFHFADLCRADVFVADYHALCAHFHTLVLEGVPRMSTEVRRGDGKEEREGEGTQGPLGRRGD
jgi:predicted ATPase